MQKDKVLTQLIRINRLRVRYLKARSGYRGVMHIILFFVRRNPGACQEDIVNFFLLDKTNVARDCRALEEKGYLIRRQDPKNRRKYQLFLTDEGMEAASRLDQVEMDYASRISGNFTEEEWKLLASLLERLAQSQAAVAEQCD